MSNLSAWCKILKRRIPTDNVLNQYTGDKKIIMSRLRLHADSRSAIALVPECQNIGIAMQSKSHAYCLLELEGQDQLSLDSDLRLQNRIPCTNIARTLGQTYWLKLPPADSGTPKEIALLTQPDTSIPCPIQINQSP